MSEMALTADHLIVIGRGRIIADAPIQSIIDSQGVARVRVRADRPQDLLGSLAADGVSSQILEPELLEITGVEPRRIAEIAVRNGVLVYELTPIQLSLEDAYLQLTSSDVEYSSHSLPSGGPVAATEGHRA